MTVPSLPHGNENSHACACKNSAKTYSAGKIRNIGSRVFLSLLKGRNATAKTKPSAAEIASTAAVSISTYGTGPIP